MRYNTGCIYCITVQIQWIQPVSASGPDTVDTYRTCRFLLRVFGRIAKCVFTISKYAAAWWVCDLVCPRACPRVSLVRRAAPVLSFELGIYIKTMSTLPRASEVKIVSKACDAVADADLSLIHI